MGFRNERRSARPPLIFDWQRAIMEIDSRMVTAYRARVGSFFLYAVREGASWRWGVSMHGATIIDGTTGTMIDGKHRAERAYRDYGGQPPQMKIGESDERKREELKF